MMTKIGYKIILIFIISIFIFSCENQQSAIINNPEWTKLTEGLVFPEGPAVSPANRVYFSNCNGGWIGSFFEGKMDTFLMKSATTFEKTNGMIYYDNFLYACEYGIGKIIKIDNSGIVEDYATEFNGKNFNRPNDLTIDKKGNIFFTDPKSYGAEKLDGRIFYIDKKNKKVSLIQKNMAFPNGIGISPIDKKLYVCESAKNRIVRFDIMKNGKLSEKEIFIELPGGDPDGFIFDKNGNIYVAHYGTGTMFIISPKGEILQNIKTPGQRPTNVEFGGNDNKTLYLTETETNALYKIQTNIAGN